jgi:hypothetical protein
MILLTLDHFTDCNESGKNVYNVCRVCGLSWQLKPRHADDCPVPGLLAPPAELEPNPIILVTLGKPVASDRSRAFYLRVRRRPPWGDEVFEGAICDEDGRIEYDEPIAWSLYRCGEILPRDHWRIGAGDGDIYFVESLAPTIPPVVG